MSKESSTERCRVLVYDPELPQLYNDSPADPKRASYKVFDLKDRKASRDPRKLRSANHENGPRYKLVKESKKAMYHSLPIPKFVWDSNSIGPKPSTQILISGLPPLITASTVSYSFKSYGDIQFCELLVDQKSGASLGLCHIRYGGRPDKAHQRALQAINESDKIKVTLKCDRIEFDEDGSKGKELQLKLAKKNNSLSTKRPTGPARSVQDTSALPKGPSAMAKKPAERPDIPEWMGADILREINGRPFIFISNSSVPLDRVTRQDFCSRFSKQNWRDIECFSDHGTLIVFWHVSDAKSCFNSLRNKRIGIYAMDMTLFDNPPRSMPKDGESLQPTEESISQTRKSTQPPPPPPKPVSTHTLPKKLTSHKSPTEEAMTQIIKDLQLPLQSAIRQRIVRAQMISLLKEHQEAYRKKMAEESLLEEQRETKLSETADNQGLAAEQRGIALHLKGIPRFSKKHQASPKVEADDESDNSGSATPQLSPFKKRLANSLKQENDKFKRRKIILPDEYESTDEMDEEKDSMSVASESASTEPSEDFSHSMDESTVHSRMEIEKDGADKVADRLQEKTGSPWDASQSLQPMPVVSDSTKVKMQDLVYIQSLVHDEEDYRFLKKALSSVTPTPIDDVKKFCDISVNVHEMNKYLQVDAGLNLGSFKSRGYTKIPDADKVYLLHRHKILQKRLDNGEAARQNEDKKSKDYSSIRMNRVNNRRLPEAEVFNLNQLKLRRKSVQFARSTIHNWGLFASESIRSGEMIIEYTGEIIRAPMDDLRERFYEVSGVGSVYMFSIDENHIIDATKRGGIARFINHSCSPSCTAKIIKMEGTKRIVIYALRDIDEGEELTYDYKFKRELGDERIPCLCGSAVCRGYLN